MEKEKASAMLMKAVAEIPRGVVILYDRDKSITYEWKDMTYTEQVGVLGEMLARVLARGILTEKVSLLHVLRKLTDVTKEELDVLEVPKRKV